jgi:hypothetical protein
VGAQSSKKIATGFSHKRTIIIKGKQTAEQRVFPACKTAFDALQHTRVHAVGTNERTNETWLPAPLCMESNEMQEGPGARIGCEGRTHEDTGLYRMDVTHIYNLADRRSASTQVHARLRDNGIEHLEENVAFIIHAAWKH